MQRAVMSTCTWEEGESSCCPQASHVDSCLSCLVLFRQILCRKCLSADKVTFPTPQGWEVGPPWLSATKDPFVQIWLFPCWILLALDIQSLLSEKCALSYHHCRITADPPPPPPQLDRPLCEEENCGKQPLQPSACTQLNPSSAFMLEIWSVTSLAQGSLSQPKAWLISLLSIVFVLGKSKHFLFLLSSKRGRAKLAAAQEQGLPSSEGSDESFPFPLSRLPSGHRPTPSTG